MGSDSGVLNRRRERTLLGVLLALGGAPVRAERLLAEVWGDKADGLGPLQVVVSRLRSGLEPERGAREAATRLVSTGGGYALHAATDEVDVWAFEELARRLERATDPEERLSLAERAEEYWTADPFLDISTPLVDTARTRLAELRLTVAEARAGAMLDLGRIDGLVSRLSPIALDNPYREGLWALLVLALYRSSRQAEALEELRTLRAKLAEDLGVDPSPALRLLEQQVLTQDPALGSPLGRSAATGDRDRLPDRQPPPAPRPSPELGTVGRESALDVLAASLDALSAHPDKGMRFLTVSGEPGIGKTHLVRELERMAQARGQRVLVSKCHEGDVAPALWPWLVVVRALTDGETEHAVRSPLAPLLHDEASADSLGGGASLRLFDAVVDLVVRAAHEPLVLIFEDVHWADDTSLRLMTHLARSGLSVPLLVVLTRRTSDAQTDGALLETMSALARADAGRVRLDGLHPDEVGTLLDRELGEHAAPMNEHVADLTGGNPFFVLEYARLLHSRPDLHGPEPLTLPVPDGVADVLRQRVARLPEGALPILVAAAVLGRVIDPDEVAALAGRPVEDVLDLCDLALAAGLLEERGSGYAFAHTLVRDTVYAQVSAARRMRLHMQAVPVLTALRGGSPDAAAVIAHHAFLAAPLGEEQAETAIYWLGRAAEVADSRSAHQEALGLWRQSASVAGLDPVASRSAKRGAARSLLRLGRTAEARDIVEDLVAIAASRNEHHQVADAAAILNEAGVWSWREFGTESTDFIAALTAAAEHVDGGREARLWATLMMEHYFGSDPERAVECGARALAAARAACDPALLREVLLVVVVAQVGRREVGERLRLARELVALDPPGELGVSALFHLGFALLESRLPVESDEVMQRCSEAATSLRHSGVDIPLAWWWCHRARARDRSDATQLTRRALALHRSSSMVALPEIECIAAVHTLGVGEQLPAETIDLARLASPAARALVAQALVEAGDPVRAVELLGEPPAAQARDYGVLTARCLRVAVLAAASATGLEEAVEALENERGRVVLYGTMDELGVVEHFLALGLSALGREAEALDLAAIAVRGNEALSNKPWLRRSQALLAQLAAKG